MSIRKLVSGVSSVGAIDWDRRLFDELIPLPDGTSYNAYLIMGSEKTALIDTVDPTKENELVENLKKVGVKKIDYLISNHAEQDHSGSIPRVLELYPQAKVVTNQKCKEMLMEMLLIPEDRFITVNDRQTLALGNKTLEFIFAPWVHWPETMFTYLKEDKILFTCDFLGSHLATSDLYALDQAKVYESAKRYYAEIMMPFRVQIKKNLEKIKEFTIETVAASHGPIYHQPEFIIKAYQEWVSDTVKNEVIVAYTSMHGSTAKMVGYFIEALMEKNITVKPFNLSRADIGELAMSLVDAATLVVGSATVMMGVHPNVVYASYLANALRPKLRFASLIGSYGWGQKMAEQLTGFLTNLKVEILPPVIAKGYPKENDFKLLDRLAENILEKHKSIGIV